MKWFISLVVSILVIIFIWIWPPGSWLVQQIQLDGKFDDWQGKAFLTEEKDNTSTGQDFEAIFWNTNENENKIYFMVKRFASNNQHRELVCRLYFDINANGSYQDAVDKYAEITYRPNDQSLGQVDVHLYSMAGKFLAAYQGNWGESYQNGGRQFEFVISMDDLQVMVTQPIRFYLAGIGSKVDRLPDKGDIQWAPFPVSVKSRLSTACICLIWLVITIFFYQQRIWVFYYMWGAVGLTCVLVLLLSGSFVEYWLEQQTSIILHHVLGYFDIITYVFDKTPGTLLVLMKMDNNWTTLDIDIENSGILEMCIGSGLILFYPVYSRVKKVFVTIAGLGAVYVFNLVRLVVVIFTIHTWGRNMNFIAHTLVGRLLFFVLVIALYWQILTRPTLKRIKRDVEDA